MHHTNENLNVIDQQQNGPRKIVHYQSYQKRNKNESRKWLENSYFMDEQYTQHL